MLYTSTDRLVGNSSLLTRFFGWIRHARPIWTAAEPQKSDSADHVEPQHLTFAEQWSHLSDTIKGALSCAEDATRCHASAALQLDLAQYALSSLVDELSAVMDVGGRRRPANVHMLDFQPPRPFDDAIAA